MEAVGVAEGLKEQSSEAIKSLQGCDVVVLARTEDPVFVGCVVEQRASVQSDGALKCGDRTKAVAGRF